VLTYYVGWSVSVTTHQTHMVSEFDLPCTDCGHDLAETTIAVTGSRVVVAECPNCGTRHYPEKALARLDTRPT
jgi:transcription elongation factor Elf1